MKNQINKIYIIISQLSKVHFPNVKKKNYYIGMYLSLCDRLIKRHGTLEASKLLKMYKLHFTRFICGSPLLESNIDTQEGIPVDLLDLKKLIGVDNEHLQFLLTILNANRCIKPKKGELIPISFSSIVDPFKGKTTTLSLNVLRKVMINMKLRPLKIREFDQSKLIMIPKAGPHGPSTLTSLKTLWFFRDANFEALKKITCANGIYFINWLKTKVKPLEGPRPIIKSCSPLKNSAFIRRLSIIMDPECKVRIIAIFDWLSQILLDVLSKDIYSVLRNIRSDRTFSQDPHFHTQVSTKNKFHSLDLTAATDRFPIDLQVQVLTLLYGTDVAQGWKKVMISEEFLRPDGLDTVRYSVGQPMGARSSWAVFALTHHIVIRYAAHLLGLPKFSHYLVLGDDVVINNDKVAKQYKRLLTSLGVEISEAKSHVSADIYEFAKRWVSSKGGEISGFPLRGIVDNFGNASVVLMYFVEFYLQRKNKYRSPLTFLRSVAEIICSANQRFRCSYQKRGKNDKRVRVTRFPTSVKRLIAKLEPLYTFSRYRMRLSTYDEMRSFLVRFSHESLYHIPSNMPDMMQAYENAFIMAVVGVGNDVKDRLKTYMDRLLNNEEFIFKDNMNHPIMLAIENHFISLKRTLRKLASRELTIEEVLSDLILYDPDVFLKESSGRKIKEFIVMGTVVKKFIAEINKEKLDSSGLASLLLGKNIQHLPFIYNDSFNIMSILYRRRRDEAFGKVQPKGYNYIDHR